MTGTLVVSRRHAAQRSLLDDTDAVLPPASEGMHPAAAASGEHPPPTRSAGKERPDEGRAPRTLEQLIVDTWEGLACGTSQCPVCGGRLEPQYGAHARPVAGRCADCGSALS